MDGATAGCVGKEGRLRSIVLVNGHIIWDALLLRREENSNGPSPSHGARIMP